MIKKILTTIMFVSGLAIAGISCLDLNRAPVKCPPGQTVYSCDVTVLCTCDLPPTTKKGVALCAASEENAKEAVSSEIKKRVPNVDSVAVGCVDTGKTTAPQNELTPSELVTMPERSPQKWGDAKCSLCVEARCKQQAINCAAEVTICHCLEQCQIGSDGVNLKNLATCGCELADSPIYEDLYYCVQSSCTQECFPVDNSCGACK